MVQKQYYLFFNSRKEDHIYQKQARFKMFTIVLNKRHLALYCPSFLLRHCKDCKVYPLIIKVLNFKISRSKMKRLTL